jgi:viroplasmin and RNaseH domain-containing protein
MKQRGVTDWDEEIDDTAPDTTPENGRKVYYAVSYGTEPGIYEAWL